MIADAWGSSIGDRTSPLRRPQWGRQLICGRVGRRACRREILRWPRCSLSIKAIARRARARRSKGRQAARTGLEPRPWFEEGPTFSPPGEWERFVGLSAGLSAASACPLKNGNDKKFDPGPCSTLALTFFPPPNWVNTWQTQRPLSPCLSLGGGGFFFFFFFLIFFFFFVDNFFFFFFFFYIFFFFFFFFF